MDLAHKKSEDLLDVAGAFINGTNLAIAPVLLSKTLAHEAHTTHPLHSKAAHTTSNLGGVQLGHGSIHDEVLTRFLLASRVVHQSPSSSNLGVGLRNLVLHSLELPNQL